MLVDRSDPLRGGSVVDGVDYCYVWVRYSLSTYQVCLLFERALILVETWRESPRALVSCDASRIGGDGPARDS